MCTYDDNNDGERGDAYHWVTVDVINDRYLLTVVTFVLTVVAVVSTIVAVVLTIVIDRLISFDVVECGFIGLDGCGSYKFRQFIGVIRVSRRAIYLPSKDMDMVTLL